MELEKIKDLLSDYYEGVTSREEEALLMDYFRHSDVPAELEADRLLFISIDKASEAVIPDKQFDEKLFTVIEENNRVGVQNGIKKSDRIGGQSSTAMYDLTVKPDGIRRMIYAVSGIAAGLLLLAGSYLIFFEKQIHNIVYSDGEYSIDDTMVAYEETRNALLLVSRVMNTGSGELGALTKFSEATRDLQSINKFHEGAKELQALTKFEETVTNFRSVE